MVFPEKGSNSFVSRVTELSSWKDPTFSAANQRVSETFLGPSTRQIGSEERNVRTEVVISSPYLRCAQTAAVICRELGPEILGCVCVCVFFPPRIFCILLWVVPYFLVVVPGHPVPQFSRCLGFSGGFLEPTKKINYPLNKKGT